MFATGIIAASDEFGHIRLINTSGVVVIFTAQQHQKKYLLERAAELRGKIVTVEYKVRRNGKYGDSKIITIL